MWPYGKIVSKILITTLDRDQTDERSVHLFDTSSGKPLNDGKPFTHRQEVLEVALNQTGLPNERKLAFIDRNHDLYLTNVRKFGSSLVPGKLGVMVQSMLWAADCPMLAAMQETRFTIWYYPAIIYVDKALLGQTLVERDTAEFGKHPVITSFLKNSISVRRAEASHRT